VARQQQQGEQQPVGEDRERAAAHAGDFVIEHHVLRRLDFEVLAIIEPAGRRHEATGQGVAGQADQGNLRAPASP
jgi:hypothetical protein